MSENDFFYDPRTGRVAGETDIVERARKAAGPFDGALYDELADEIERLREHLQDQYQMGHHDGYHDALEEAANVAEQHGIEVSNEKIGKACSRNIAAAIRALKEKEGQP